MDRDVYLILVGAGISLASSIVVLLVQYWLGNLRERKQLQREEKVRKAKEIRAELMRTDLPPSIAQINDREKKARDFAVKLVVFLVLASITSGALIFVMYQLFLIP